MDIACPYPNCINDHLVNGVDDGRILAEVLFVNAEVFNRFTFKRGGCTHRPLNPCAQETLCCASIETDNRFIDVCFIGENWDNLAICDELELVNEHDI